MWNKFIHIFDINDMSSYIHYQNKSDLLEKRIYSTLNEIEHPGKHRNMNSEDILLEYLLLKFEIESSVPSIFPSIPQKNEIKNKIDDDSRYRRDNQSKINPTRITRSDSQSHSLTSQAIIQKYSNN